MMDTPPVQNRIKAFDIEKLDIALQRAGREARRRHALEGRSVPIIEDGKIVWLTPEQILADDAQHDEKSQRDEVSR